MCGIIGYIGKDAAVPILVEGLKKLEYRGYDSAGVAVLQNGKFEVRRAVGKLHNLETLLRSETLTGRIGVAQRTADPRKRTPIRTGPASSRWSITASSRITPRSRRNSWPRAAYSSPRRTRKSSPT